MRTFVRAVFGLNALYQSIVGVLCVFAPAMAMQVYGAPPDIAGAPFAMGAFRVLGAAILIGAVMSFLIARDPDRHRILLPLMGILAVLTLIAEALMLMNGEAGVSQLAIDLVFQVAVIFAAFAYRPGPA